MVTAENDVYSSAVIQTSKRVSISLNKWKKYF